MENHKYLNNHQEYMKQALDLSERGRGQVSPNPLVGCVIVKDNRIIGEGYHSEFGGDHAEIMALKNCTESPIGAALYVNLEPCSIYGKTPPCIKAIIENSISEVYIGVKDPNPKINGNGIFELEKAGIRVTSDILYDKCLEKNKSFFKWVVTREPYVIAKVAQTKDGYMGYDNKTNIWITGEKSKKHTHSLRSNVDAIMIGKNTAKIDNPKLTVREVIGKNPKRIVLDTNRQLPLSLNIFNDRNADTYILCSESRFENNKTSFSKFIGIKEKDGFLDPSDILKKLGREGITSILIEGGTSVHKSFLNAKLIDEIYLYTSNKNIEGASLKNPLILDGKWITSDKIFLDDDTLTISKKKELCLQEL
jgi:diaminohydroxyphosphoribosylaminopyrimidine deaminase/5-amino-6-(5-phosphoribosylamino)uracil reductase